MEEAAAIRKYIKEQIARQLPAKEYFEVPAPPSPIELELNKRDMDMYIMINRKKTKYILKQVKSELQYLIEQEEESKK